MIQFSDQELRDFWLIGVLISTIITISFGASECPANYCRQNKCLQDITSCPEGSTLLENSTTCGCCHSCVKVAGLDETCIKTVTQNIPAVICGDQLYCANNSPLPKCVQGDTKCLSQRAQALNSDLNQTNYIPDCDTFGNYFNYQCFGKRCFCVDENSTRIFGDFLNSDVLSVNCACSRDRDNINKFLEKPQSPGNSPQCQPNGNYQTLQTTNSRAYCVDPSIGEGRSMQGVPVALNNVQKLSCYTKKDYPCWLEFARRTEKLQRLKKQYNYVVGYELPDCDLDGSYKPKQCDKISCFCVNKKGERFGAKVTFPRDSPEIEQMRCNCIRDKNMLRLANEESWSDFDCDHLGNYNSMQCFNGTCFCADLNGLPIDYQRYNKTSLDILNCNEAV